MTSPDDAPFEKRLKAKLTRQYNALKAENQAELAYRHEQRQRVMNETQAVLEPEVITRAAIFEAQALYMRYVPLSRISAETGVTNYILKQQIYRQGGWKEQREQIHKDISEQVKVASLSQLRKAAGISLHLITLSLEKVARECADTGEAPDLHEADVIAGIFSKLHKAKVVEEMDEDEKKKIGLSPNEVLKALGSDPYLRKAIAIHAEPEAAVDPADEEEDAGPDEDSEPQSDTI